MKSIEERIDEWEDRPGEWTRGCLMAMMNELAADLNSEKEKEVALMKIFHETPHARELAELRAWKESALQVMPDFQKLGELLGLLVGSSVSEQLVPAIEKLTKEVAELREKLAAIEAGSDIQNLSVSSHFELDCGPQAPMSEEWKTETWECRACHKDAPCTVTVRYQDTGYPEIDEQPRFRNRGCLCLEPRMTDWKRIETKEPSHE